jgi:hypothetical protein
MLLLLPMCEGTEDPIEIVSHKLSSSAAAPLFDIFMLTTIRELPMVRNFAPVKLHRAHDDEKIYISIFYIHNFISFLSLPSTAHTRSLVHAASNRVEILMRKRASLSARMNL